MGRDVHGMGRQKVKKHDRKPQVHTHRKKPAFPKKGRYKALDVHFRQRGTNLESGGIAGIPIAAIVFLKKKINNH
jgi:hypothetical protein